jgi:hypothetical protein
MDASLLFDGKELKLRGPLKDGSEGTLRAWKAVSGMKANNKKLAEFGRKHAPGVVTPGCNYTGPQFQHLAFVGPIQAGTYYLKLSVEMPYEKTGGGWGVGAWQLHFDSQVDRIQAYVNRKTGKRIFDQRDEFFLHEDGGRDGTAGCIGLQSRMAMEDLRKHLKNYAKQGYARMAVKVEYGPVTNEACLADGAVAQPGAAAPPPLP